LQAFKDFNKQNKLGYDKQKLPESIALPGIVAQLKPINSVASISLNFSRRCVYSLWLMLQLALELSELK
jgi:hypothetical protein